MKTKDKIAEIVNGPAPILKKYRVVSRLLDDKANYKLSSECAVAALRLADTPIPEIILEAVNAAASHAKGGSGYYLARMEKLRLGVNHEAEDAEDRGYNYAAYHAVEAACDPSASHGVREAAYHAAGQGVPKSELLSILKRVAMGGQPHYKFLYKMGDTHFLSDAYYMNKEDFLLDHPDVTNKRSVSLVEKTEKYM